jgi:hypothetical protein
MEYAKLSLLSEGFLTFLLSTFIFFNLDVQYTYSIRNPSSDESLGLAYFH